MEVNIFDGVFRLFIIFFLTIYLDVGNCTCTEAKELINKKDLSNTTITELSLWFKSGVKSPTACASYCGRDKHCVSFFYNTQSGVCTAHTVQFYSTEPTTADEASLYYTLPVDKRDCAEILNNDPDSGSGVYIINPADGVGHFRVYCDMTTDGGGWTVFQRRQDGSVDFYKYWADYKGGFGQVDDEFWLGNDNINRLTSQGSYKLKIDMRDQEDQSGYATYSTFNVENEANNYRLTATGYTGDRGDSLAYHSDEMFSTRLRDHDQHVGNCAESRKAAWWYNSCTESNLNGVYGVMGYSGISWYSWHGPEYSLKWVEMKLKPN